jgi:hypothetical protein
VSSIELVAFGPGRLRVRICDDWRYTCTVAGVAALRVARAPHQRGGADPTAQVREHLRRHGTL